MKECLSVLALCFSRDGLKRLKEIGTSFLPVTLERGYLQGYTGQINLVPGGGGEGDGGWSGLWATYTALEHVSMILGMCSPKGYGFCAVLVRKKEINF